MAEFQHFDLLSSGAVSRIRLRNLRREWNDDFTALASEWNPIADRADCRTLVVDCSGFQYLSSDLLSKLILLQRRLKRKNGNLLLCGISAEGREVLHWTKLDRLFEIATHCEQAAAAFA
jgi:anti-anti-sigma factor